MSNVLSAHTRYRWPTLRHLMCRMMSHFDDLLTEPGRSSSNAVHTLYGGVLRLLSVLLQEFAKCFCSSHKALVEDLPRACATIQNVLSASFPHSMQLPNPFSQSLNVEELPEMMELPLLYRIIYDNPGLCVTCLMTPDVSAFDALYPHI